MTLEQTGPPRSKDNTVAREAGDCQDVDGTLESITGRRTAHGTAAEGLARLIKSNPALYRTAVALLLVLASALYLKQFGNYQVGMEWDDAQYVQLAQSIALGRPYVVDTGSGVILPTRYPFGFPLILAPVYALSNGNFEALKSVSLVFTLASVVLILVGWEYLGLPSRWFGLATAALYALSPQVTAMSREVMSEPAFTFFVLLGLIITISVSLDQHTDLVKCIGLGIIWLLASNVRIIGFAFVAASVLYLLLRRKWSTLALSVLGFAITLTSIISLTSLHWSDTYNVRIYLDELTGKRILEQNGVATGLIPRAWQGLVDYQSYLRDSLVPFVGSSSIQSALSRFGLAPVLGMVSGFVFILLVIGYVDNLRRRSALPALGFVAFYGIVTIAWSYRGERFLFGILPFLFGYLLIAGNQLLKVVMPKMGRVMRGLIPFLGVGAVILFIGLQFAASMRTESWVGHTRNFEIGASWIRENTPPDAFVVAEHNEIIHLYAGRATGPLPDTTVSLVSSLPSHRSVYLLVAPEIEWSPTGALRYTERTQLFREALKTGVLPADLVYDNEPAMVMVYRLRPVMDTAH